MELVDVLDSKSGVGNYVPVRPRPSAFIFYTRRFKMKIQNITPAQVFCAKNYKVTLKNNTPKPVHEGLTTAGAWFGFGVGLDFVSRKFHLSKSPTKNSLALNGLVGSAAGLFTAWQVSHNKSSEE